MSHFEQGWKSQFRYYQFVLGFSEHPLIAISHLGKELKHKFSGGLRHVTPYIVDTAESTPPRQPRRDRAGTA